MDTEKCTNKRKVSTKKKHKSDETKSIGGQPEMSPDKRRKRKRMMMEEEEGKPNDHESLEEVKESFQPGEITSADTKEPVCEVILCNISFQDFKVKLREREKKIKKLPKIHLEELGHEANLESPSRTSCLFLRNIQNFINYTQFGHMTLGGIPRWITIEKFNALVKTLIVVIEGVSIDEFISAKDSLPALQKFEIKVEVMTSFSYGGNLIEDLLYLPISATQKHRLENKFGSLEAARRKCYKTFRVISRIFNIPPKRAKSRLEEGPNDAFSRTELLLAPWQMFEEGFPMPTNNYYRFSGFVNSKDEYLEVTSRSPIWAVDCEMCQTTVGNELTRISIVNEKLEVVYEKLVKPDNKIVDYLTKFSGITKKTLQGITTRLEDVHEDLRYLLPGDVILCGHSLNCDLKAMKMMHPYVIDTSVIFNVSGDRARKSKLKLLAEMYLGEKIQTGTDGHNSVEDASSAMKLVLKKLKHGLDFGDAAAKNCASNNNEPRDKEVKHKVVTPAKDLDIKNCKEEIREEFTINLLLQVARNKPVVLIATKDIIGEYMTMLPPAKVNETATNKLHIVQVENKRQICDTVKEQSVEKGLTILHLRLKTKTNSIHKVDRYVNTIMDSLPPSSLMGVLLAGKPGSTNSGLFMTTIKKLIFPKLLRQADDKDNIG